MTAVFTSGQYTGGYGDLSIYITVGNIIYTSPTTGVFAGNCNYYGDFISLSGTFNTPNIGSAQGTVIRMQSTQSSGTRVSGLNIELNAADPYYSLLEGSHTIHFTNSTWGTNYLGVRRV
ncbi:hypothetical protein IFT91_10910 [Pseudomonas fluorescens]|nr:hypothetical protein [Pseudomonas fluorescens]